MGEWQPENYKADEQFLVSTVLNLVNYLSSFLIFYLSIHAIFSISHTYK